MTERQNDQPSIGDLPVLELVERVGDETPAPGGGAVASIAGAMAGALLRMTASYSLEADVPEREKQRLDEIRAVSNRLLELAEEDRRAYEAYQEIRSREQSDASEEVEALVRSTEVPLEMHGCCVELLGYFESLRDRIKPAFQADVNTAISMLRVTLETATELVEYNLQELPDGRSREHLSETLASQKSDLEELQTTNEE